MQTFYDRFKELSDENLLQRVNRKEHYKKEAVLAAFHILQQRGYNIENPFPESSDIETQKKSKRRSFLEREYHVWHKMISDKKSSIRIILFFSLFVPLLWYSNTYLNETTLYRKIHLATQTILSHGGITYLIESIIIFFLFVTSKENLNKFLTVKSKHIYVALKVLFFSILIISIWEWLFSSKMTITLIADNKSARELLKNFWFGGLIAFTEELIFKWLLLTQLLLRVGDSAGNRRLIFFIVAILFAAAHIPIQIAEFGGISTSHLIKTFLYSYFTSILYVKLRNFPLVVLLHFFMNISAVFIDDGKMFYFNWSTVLLGIYSIPKINSGWLFRPRNIPRLPKWVFGSLIFVITIGVAISPKTSRDYYNYSKQYYYMDSYPKAMDLISKAISEGSRDAEFINHRGNIYYSLDNYDSAWNDYDHAVQIDSTFYGAIRNRGLAAKQTSKFNECIEDLTIAIAENIQTSRVYRSRGSCYLGIEEPELAISDFEEAIQRNISNSEAYYGLGRAYLKMKNFDQSLENLELAIAIDPNFIEAYEVLAMTYTGLGKYDSSNVVMTKAIEMGSKSPVRFYLRGLNYYEKEDYYNAIKEFEKSIEFNPENPDLYLNLAYSHFFLEDYNKGCEYLNQSAFLGNEDAQENLSYYCG